MKLKKGDRIEETNDAILIEALKQSGFIQETEIPADDDTDDVKPKKKGKKGE